MILILNYMQDKKRRARADKRAQGIMNMYKTNEQLKKQIKQACLTTYGFAPALNDIVLEECNRDGTYIRCHMKKNGQTYVFASEIMTEWGLEGTIWCGKGTITAVSAEF